MKPSFRAAIAASELLLATSLPLRAQAVTFRASVSSAGVQSNSDSSLPSLSSDGRYVAFSSYGSNLVAGDTNGVSDVFVRDNLTGQLTRASTDSSGVQGNADSLDAALSGDGRFVAFDSAASNLVAGDTNARQDVFIHDLRTGQTTRLSVNAAGTQGNLDSFVPSVSGDGRYVAFHSAATNLVASDTNGQLDVFVRDRQTGQITRASVDSAGGQANSYSYFASISADGQRVAFFSDATNLALNDTNAAQDVFLHDMQTGQTSLVSVSSSGVQSNGNSAYPTISADGSHVAFYSVGTNLVAGDTNLMVDVFVRDVQTGQTTRESVDSAGVQGNGVSEFPALSRDGRYVAFFSSASNLVAGDTNGTYDIFLRDRATGQTTRASVDSAGGQANSYSQSPQISADGREIVFVSAASNLVAGDTNASADVFVRAAYATPTAYCVAGTTTNGCVPAIGYSGTPSAASGSGFTITVSAVEGQKQGLLFYGIDNAGFTPAMWGSSSSYLCVKPPTQRMSVQTSGGTNNACNGALSSDWNSFIATNAGALGNPYSAGQYVFAQAWFRDPPSPKTTMLSNAIEFVVGP